MAIPFSIVPILSGTVTPQANPGALTDNSGGGAADGTIGAVTNPDLSAWNGAAAPTAAQATAIGAAVTALKDAIKELSTKQNSMRTALISAGVLT